LKAARDKTNGSGGAITEIQTGACEVKGTISYAGQVIVEKKVSPINLPGRLPVPGIIGELLQPIAKAQGV